MTRGGYLVMLAAYAGLALLGAWLAAPSPSEIGLVRTATCAEWAAEPFQGPARLTDCVVDRFALLGYSSSISLTAPDADEATARIEWRTVDPVLTRLRSAQNRTGADCTIDPPSECAAVRRGADRFARELDTPRDVVGEIEAVPRSSMYGDDDRAAPYRIVSPESDGPGRRIGLLLFALFGGLALMLTFLQRRWMRRARELGGTAQPKRF
ncbi:MAG: hypothetical protein AB7S26_00685 [Sandaracinaceae bacterium]